MQLENLKIKGKKILVLGAGNEMKGDDRLGKYVIDRLNTENKIFCGEMPENFINKIKSLNPEVLLIVDAVDFQGKAGEVIFTPASNVDGSTLTTHSISFSLMVKMLSGIDIYLIGVQPKSLEFGDNMSLEVKKGADEIVGILNKALS